MHFPRQAGYKSETFFQLAEDLSDQLNSMPGLTGEVVIDDRTQMTVGKRLYEARRLGYPHVVIIGKKVRTGECMYNNQLSW